MKITHTHEVEEVEDKDSSHKIRGAALFAMIGTGAVASVAAARALRSSSDTPASIEAAERQDLLTQNLNDMLALVRDIYAMAGRHLDDPQTDEYPGVQSLIEQVERVMERHVEELEREIHATGGSVSAVKGAVAATAGAVGGLVSRLRQQPVSRMLRDTYVSLGTAAISYTMLHATARSLSRDATANLAQRCLEDVTPLIIRISEEIPSVVIQELASEGRPVDLSVSEAAMESTQEAWRTQDPPSTN
jgi:hypothetical protein